MHKQLSFGTKKKRSLQLNSGQLLQEAPTELQQDSGVYDTAWPTLYCFKMSAENFQIQSLPKFPAPLNGDERKKVINLIN